MLLYTNIIDMIYARYSPLRAALQHSLFLKNQKNCLLIVCSCEKDRCDRVSPLSSRVFLGQNYC